MPFTESGKNGLREKFSDGRMTRFREIEGGSAPGHVPGKFEGESLIFPSFKGKGKRYRVEKKKK